MRSRPAWGGNETAAIDAERTRLRTALGDPNPFVRAGALGRSGSDERAVAAMTGALGDDYPMVRREAVRALSRVGGAEAARALVGAAAHDLSVEIREEAVAGLAAILRAPTAASARS